MRLLEYKSFEGPTVAINSLQIRFVKKSPEGRAIIYFADSSTPCLTLEEKFEMVVDDIRNAEGGAEADWKRSKA